MSGSDSLGLLVFVVMNMVAAASGALFRPGDWYEALAKPRWRPPNWLFGPAWSVLYSMNAVAGWLVWRDHDWETARGALAVYGVSLILNAGWSGVFFGLRRPGLALVELVGLWLSIAAMIAAFLPLHEGAALLLLPYLCWVTFAGVLNHAIWRLNPQVSQAG